MSRTNSLKCRTIRSLGPDLVESDRLPAVLTEHSATCLRCQAEVARYRRLGRELGSLGTETLTAPDSIVPAVEVAVGLDHPAEPKAAPRVAAIAGATAAAASVVAVALWRRSKAAA